MKKLLHACFILFVVIFFSVSVNQKNSLAAGFSCTSVSGLQGTYDSINGCVPNSTQTPPPNSSTPPLVQSNTTPIGWYQLVGGALVNFYNNSTPQSLPNGINGIVTYSNSPSITLTCSNGNTVTLPPNTIYWAYITNIGNNPNNSSLAKAGCLTGTGMFSLSNYFVPSNNTNPSPGTQNFNMSLTSVPPFYAGSVIALQNGPIGGTGNSNIYFSSKTNPANNFIVPAVGTNGWQIVGKIPSGAIPGDYTIQVITNVPDTSNIISLTISPPPKPSITTILPSTIYPSTFISIIGTNFSPSGNIIQFSSPAISLTGQRDSATSITGTIAQTTPPGTYSVQVFNSNGTSNTVSFTVKDHKAAPSNLKAVMSSTKIGQVDLTWTDNSGGTATEFEVMSAYDKNGTDFKSIIAADGLKKTSYTDDLDLEDIRGTNNYYRVRAFFPDGSHSDYSNIASVSNCVKVGGNGPIKFFF